MYLSAKSEAFTNTQIINKTIFHITIFNQNKKKRAKRAKASFKASFFFIRTHIPHIACTEADTECNGVHERKITKAIKFIIKASETLRNIQKLLVFKTISGRKHVKCL